LQGEVRSVSFGTNQEHSEINRLKKESLNLERLLADLKEELQSRLANSQLPRREPSGYQKAQGYGDYEDWEDEKVALEIDI